MSGLIKSSLTRMVPAVRANVMQSRTTVSAPPKYAYTFTQKAVVGGTMCFLILSPMLWILANVKHYKNPTGAPETE